MTHPAAPAHDDDYEDQSAFCPRCSGIGSIDCHCGGDLCVCDNYGEADCPLCYGEGTVSNETFDLYSARQARHWSGWHITQHYIRLRTAAEKHTPGGVLLPADMPPIWRATARDAGVTVDEVTEWVRDNE